MTFLGRRGMDLFALALFGLCCFATSRYFEDTLVVLLTGGVVWIVLMFPASLAAAMVVKALRGRT